MNSQTQLIKLTGPAGVLACAVDRPASAEQGLALLCHPHPLHGGTMDNKVVQTLARAFVQLGYRCVRFNFRGVGESQGVWDEGRGEIDDALAVLAASRDPARPDSPIMVAGFSFGAYVASHVMQRRQQAGDALLPGVLVGTAVTRFAVAGVPQDTLLIHGQADDVVPLDPVLAFAGEHQLPVTVMPGAGHFFHGQLAALRTTIQQGWLGRVALRQLAPR
ncbi:alpha/beta hydrolase [Amphibiibacter pelophylacis]|uniref:Alpha/beta fold hydrolase n=1 Tax=Amphibiibacter pelophylacis TaxID=1799477 RepID=A0ACC6NXZ0_9BURK